MFQKAISYLILNEPFYACFVMQMKVFEDKSCKTAWTDGESIGYNPEFVEKLSFDERVGLLIHEVMHVALLHHVRGQGFIHEKWNHAGDYAINWIIANQRKPSGQLYKLPKGGLINPNFAGMDAESIYRLLPDGQNGGKGQGKGQGKQGQGQGQPDSGSFGEVRQAGSGKAERQEIADKTRRLVKQALRASEKMGRGSSDMKREVEAHNQELCNLEEVLARFVNDLAQNDYTFSRPNTRFGNFILPTLYNKELSPIILCVDTSGSISAQEVAVAVEALISVLQIYETTGKPVELQVIYCDDSITRIETLGIDDTPKPRGGGGTSFVPPFKWIAEQDDQPAGVIYFTDGCCNLFPDEPEFPVLWGLMRRNDNFKPPFGETFRVSLISEVVR